MTRNYHILSILLTLCVVTTTFAVSQTHSNSLSIESNGVSSEQITNGGHVRQNQTRGNGQQGIGTRVTGARGKRGASLSNSPSVESNGVSSEQVRGNGQGGQPGAQGGYGGRGVGNQGQQNQTRRNGTRVTGTRGKRGASLDNSPSVESNDVSSEQVLGNQGRQNQTRGNGQQGVGTRVTGVRGKRGANWSNSPSVESVESNDISSQQIGQGSQVGAQGGYGGRGQNFGQNRPNFPGFRRQNQTRGNGQQGQQFGNQNGFSQREKRGADWSNSLSVESNGVSSEQVLGNRQGSQLGTQGGYGGRGVGNQGQQNQTRRNGTRVTGTRGKRSASLSNNPSVESNGVSSEEVLGNGQIAQAGYGGQGRQNQTRGNGQQGLRTGVRGKRQANGSNSPSVESNDISSEQVTGNGQPKRNRTRSGFGQTGSSFPGVGQNNDQQNQQFGTQNGFGGRAKRAIDQEDIQGLRNLTRANAQALRTLITALDTTQEREILRIVSNRSLSRDQLEAATDQWAAQQNETVQQAYQQYKQTLEQLVAEMEEIHNELAANLTAPARAVDQQLMAILSNGSLNHAQQCQQISRILANTTQEIKRELKRTFGPLPCQQGHHGRFGGHRGRWSNSDEFGGRGRGGVVAGRGNPFGNNQGPFGQQPFQNRGNRRNGFFDDSNESRFGGRNGQSGNNGQFGGRGGRGGNNQQPWFSGAQGGQFGQPSWQQFGRGQSPFGNNGGFGSPFGGNQQQQQGSRRFQQSPDW